MSNLLFFKINNLLSNIKNHIFYFLKINNLLFHTTLYFFKINNLLSNIKNHFFYFLKINNPLPNIKNHFLISYSTIFNIIYHFLTNLTISYINLSILSFNLKIYCKLETTLFFLIVHHFQTINSIHMLLVCRNSLDQINKEQN